jgi:hypothetical protein
MYKKAKLKVCGQSERGKAEEYVPTPESAVVEQLVLVPKSRSVDPKEKLITLRYTDHGNEQAFELIHGTDYLYNWTSRQWLHWNGIIWEPDFVENRGRAKKPKEGDCCGLETPGCPRTPGCTGKCDHQPNVR